MPRKTVKEQKQKRVTDTDVNRNRIRSVTDGLVGNEDPDDIMLELMETLDELTEAPQSGRFYIFVYNPKTPNIEYDQNPFIAMTDIFEWGFRGVNFHWGQTRQYTWNEVAGSLYEVYASEVKDLQALPFAKFRLNN